MRIPNKVYDVLKWIVTLIMPAVATLLSALTAAWNWNIPLDSILATFVALETFVGGIIGISTINYIKESENKDDK